MVALDEERSSDELRNQPVYWYVSLETALERGDFAAAAIAQEELRKLGRVVDIRSFVREDRHD